MATLFAPRSRPSLYFRAIIPRHLRPLFSGRSQLWRSLKTNDKDDARLRSLTWQSRTQQLFLTLKRHGERMNKTEIDALIARWMDAELDEAEDYRAAHRLNEDQREHMVDETIERLKDTEATLAHSRYDRVAADVDGLLTAAGLPVLTHDSLDFKRACRTFLLAKQDHLTNEIQRWQNLLYTPAPRSLAVAPVVAKPSPLCSVVMQKYLTEIPRAKRTVEQVRTEMEKFLVAIGGDRPIGTITKEDGRVYKEYLLHRRKVSLATVSKQLHTLSGLFTWAEKQGYRQDGQPNPPAFAASGRAT